ncbi:MAG: 1-acyl-sn-glycerol-3-phosphate acyltransferase [Desulfobacterium sp.]|jgi:glycerol-3-phosphate O-acyltransferase|nr:1-acyl-sn-glycerol-3-phosphate acyltransferase [Desulfobacterium sp.]
MNYFTPRLRTIKRKKDALFNWASTFFDTRNDHFSCLYTESASPVASWIFKLTFSKIQFNHQRLAKLYRLNEQGMVVYSVKYKNLFEFLYLNWAMQKKGLPYPEIGMDMGFVPLLPLKQVVRIAVGQLIHFFRHMEFKDPYHSGYITKELSKGRTGFLYLVGNDAFFQRVVKSKPDPLHMLIDLQKESERPIFFVAHTVVFSSKPIRRTPTLLDIFLGSNEKPGRLRRLVALIQRPDKISVEFSDPVNLKTFLVNSKARGLETQFQVPILRNHLVDLLNGQKRCVTGPVLKTRGELFEDILTDKTLQEFMRSYSESKGESLTKTKQRATEYFKEIAANYNLTTIYTFEKILTWTFNNIFEGLVIDQDGLDRVKEASQKAPLILVPCHKSHLDYLLLSYLMFKNSMPCPHVAAGKNLSFWPLGPIFRGGGAFFLRRTFKGAVLYSKIFSTYIEKLLFEGFNLEFFIEGGRSRSGKLLSPKLGLLSILINAQQNGACSDLLFIPIYVGYDRVLEEDSYLHEIEGGKKKPESLFQLIKARKFLKKKYGKVYINFNQPISLKEYISETNPAPGIPGKADAPWQEPSVENLPANRLDEEGQRRICKGMGYKLINSINSISIVTPYGIMANCILNSPGNRFSFRDLKSRANVYMNLLIFFNAELSDTLIMDPNLAFYQVIHSFVSRKFIELADESDPEITETTRFIVKDNKRPILDYYKNNAISFFVPAAYTAVSILKRDTFQFSSQNLALTYSFLQDFFIDEFSFDEEKSCQEHIQECLKAFVDQGIMVPTPRMPDTFNITSEGFRRLKLFSSLLDPFLESYKVALLFFETFPADKFDEKERIKKIQALGVKMYKRQEIVLKESLSKMNYVNACNRFIRKGIKGSEDLATIQHYKEIIDPLLEITAVNRP